MLLKLLNQVEKPKFIVISDSLDVTGTTLFHSFVTTRCKNTVVHVFLFETHPEDFLTSLKSTNHGNIVIYDFYTDPLNWDDGENTILKSFVFSKTIENPASHTDQFIVAIDGVGMYLNNHPANQLYQDLQRLKQNPQLEQCILLIHSDEIDQGVKKSVEYLSNAVLSLSNEELEVERAQDKTAFVRRPRNNVMVCQTIFKKLNGKMLQFDEEIKIASDFQVSAMKWSLPNHNEPREPIPPPSDEPSVVSDLSFNLKLSNEEKKQRGKLVMPYTQAKLAVKMEEKTSGEIIYELDDVDDYDEEDPDDDLDF
ncbi:elongator complex protein 5 [Ciona intestinalis]